MLKERETFIRRLTMMMDMAVIAAAFFAAYYLRVHFHVFYKFDIVPSAKVVGAPVTLDLYMPVLLMLVPLWVFMLYLNGAYGSFRTRSFLEMAWVIVKASFFGALSFASLTFIFKIQFISRVFFILFVLAAAVFLIIEKYIVIVAAHNVRRRGYNTRRVLIVGTGPRARRFAAMIRKNKEWGFKIAGLIDDEKSRVGKRFFGSMVLGTLRDLPRILREKVIDEVVFVVPRMWLERIQETIALCEVLGIKTSVATDLFDLKIAKAKQTDLNGLPLLVFETTFAREWQLFVKRAADLIISLIALVALSPLFLIVAALIKMTSPGPIFFKQKRVTLNGRVFTLYKFRSMYKDANERLEEVKHLNEVDGPVFKSTKDPRITPLGRFLRKMSIDELPQLINVFEGHMSLVGPRPPLPAEVEKYQPWQIRRLSMRGGITCLWQVSGRSRISFEKWMQLDLEYIDNWSLWLDFKILARTIPAVLLGTGAK